MIKSMTAFARGEATRGEMTATVEIRAYNSRHLDVALKLPHGYQALEERLNALVASRLTRGRIELRVGVEERGEASVAFEVDVQKAASYHAALRRLKEDLALEGGISLDLVAAAGGIVKASETPKNIEACAPLVEACVSAALDDLEDMRQREGAFIAVDFDARLARLEELVAAIEDKADGLLPYYQERLKERIAALSRGVTEIDATRIAQEAAILADRSDISEELLRARSHIEQFRTIMAGDEASGRKLNFLLQEFNREFNTMGSKTGKAAIAYLVVEAKAELEKLREQVQNVE